MSWPVRCITLYLLCVSTLAGAELPVPVRTLEWDAASTSRQAATLNGPWSLSAGDQGGIVEVPGTFENQIAVNFDGIATYRVDVKPFEILEGHRLLVEFRGAATSATVKFNDKQLGVHVGGWTPFRWDATQAIKDAIAIGGESGAWKLEVELDELVGHHTQGFLPIVAPHFGGLWQDVRLLIVPPLWIDDFQLRAIGNCETGRIDLSIPIEIPPDYVDQARVIVEVRGPGEPSWAKVADEPMTAQAIDRGGSRAASATDRTLRFVQQLSVNVSEELDAHPRRWTPDDPALYDVQVTVQSHGTADVVRARCGFRSIAVRGDRFLLNDQSLSIRGVLNWGYAPPRTAPTLDEQRMRSEIELAKSYGFNLMKFCLWIPPKRYLELCDELGMLAWIEYPTWHAQLTPENLSELQREYREFFAYDRNHPSIVLRSLTCETGPSADLGVIQSLYDLAKVEIPGAVVEDDSSWIEWNRVNDFYDDHPYGNNHTWPRTLERLTGYIAQRDVKPLVLGEAIAADTWTDPASFASPSTTAEGEEPFYWPMHLRDNVRWLNSMGISGSRELLDSSRRYALLMRKYQIETYRRMVPHGGYVVSVIRDFPLASMGLVDYHDQPKWSREQWGFHGETMILLGTENDRRSFHASEEIVLPLAISAQGPRDLQHATLHVSLREEPLAETDRSHQRDGESQSFELGTLRAGELSEWVSCRFAGRTITEPTRFVVEAELKSKATRQRNDWSIWVFPDVKLPVETIARHSSWPQEFMKKELEAYHVGLSDNLAAGEPGTGIIVARHFDRELLDRLEAGCRVLMVPDGESGSFTREEHWFLRGGPVVGEGAARLGLMSSTATADAVLGGVSEEAQWFVELQHFDLGGPVVPRIDTMLPSIDTSFALWDNHDRPETRTHGLLFSLPVGKGKLIVSTLNHEGATNAAGQWLLAKILQSLLEPDQSRSGAAVGRGERNLAQLRSEVDRYSLELHDRRWAFQPDPEQRGKERGWHTTDFEDRQWPQIRADRAWEGEGYESLDGWAWYRLQVELPQELQTATHVYLNFTGVDDHYLAYVEGQVVGSGGDIAAKRTAFEDRTSHEITAVVRGKSTIQLAVAVYDWYGAGGIFRPVSLSTTPLGGDTPWLK